MTFVIVRSKNSEIIPGDIKYKDVNGDGVISDLDKVPSAKVLLYAASPLANGNTEMVDLTDDQGNCLISQTYDESKWARAAAAAKDVMDLNFMSYILLLSENRLLIKHIRQQYVLLIMKSILTGIFLTDGEILIRLNLIDPCLMGM